MATTGDEGERSRRPASACGGSVARCGGVSMGCAGHAARGHEATRPGPGDGLARSDGDGTMSAATGCTTHERQNVQVPYPCRANAARNPQRGGTTGRTSLAARGRGRGRTDPAPYGAAEASGEGALQARRANSGPGVSLNERAASPRPPAPDLRAAVGCGSRRPARGASGPRCSAVGPRAPRRRWPAAGRPAWMPAASAAEPSSTDDTFAPGPAVIEGRHGAQADAAPGGRRLRRLLRALPRPGLEVRGSGRCVR